MKNQMNSNGKKMSTITKRFLAFLLAFAMIMQPTLSLVGTIVYAEETTEAGADVSEPQVGTEVQQPAAEPAQPAVEPAQPAVEPAEPAPADDGSGQAATDADAQNQPASDQPVADPDEKKDETEDDEEEKFPAQSFNGAISGLSVSVSAPEGALPEESTMKVSPVSQAQVIKAVERDVKIDVEKVRAADITFYNKEGKEVEPKVPVAVSMNASGLDKSAAKTVVHIDDNGKAEKVVGASVTKAGVAEFAADDFSIYVIVDEGQDARVLVKFVKPDGTEDGTEIKSIYVKKEDNMEQVLYDPGVGTIDSDVYFRGWTTEKNYTPETPAMSIAEVRSDVQEMLPPSQDGVVVTYYAMLFKSYRITFYDENGISLGEDEVSFRADSTETSQNYSVNMAYTVSDNTHNFEGWKVNKGSTYIEGYNPSDNDGEGTYYQNGTTIKISGSVEFGVNAPEGHWLVFDENGKGATYNAPRFLKTGEVTSKPRPDNEMTRFGYTFKGWYKDQACTEEFVFGGELTDYTTIYAKWESNPKANYSVVIWKQNVNGDGYDFYKSIEIADATVDTTPNAVRTNGSGNNSYATVNNIAYRYNSNDAAIKAAFTGFHFSSTNQSEKTVVPEGNTVVNVWYDRNEITYNFSLYSNGGYVYTLITGAPSTASGHPTYYANINGQYRELEYYPNNSGWPNYNPPGWYYGGSWISRGTHYTGSDFYIRESTPTGWNVYKTVTGLYGSTLADNDFEWPTEYNWFKNGHGTGGNQGTGGGYRQGDVSGIQTTFLDAFLPTDMDVILNGTENFYGKAPEGTSNYTIYFYKQNATKTGYEEANTIHTTVGSFNISDKYSGFYAHHYVVDNGQDQTLGEKDANGYYAQGVSFSNSLKIYYNRNDFVLSFLNGSYYSSEGNAPTLEETASPTKFQEIDHITFGASLESYNKGGDDYFEPDPLPGYEGYVFDGWYLDDKCTHACHFSTMPEDGLTVYAKWVKIQYRAFLHPNYPEGATGDIDWGTANQQMNFRVNYGGKISAPTGLLNGYEFVGWYSDSGCTQAFNPNAFVLNETTVSTAYNKSTDYTDPYDPNGNLGPDPSNSDLTGYDGHERFWITKKYDIYAKWRSVLDGASGIGVVYDPNGGSNPPSDTKTYVDGAEASAGAASTPSSADKKFGYWVMQKWDSSQNKYVDVSGSKIYPGKTFEVLASYAKVENITPSGDSTDTKKYTVQLRAEYIDSEAPTPTHIYWYDNFGGTYREDTNLEINAAVPVYGYNDGTVAAPTKEGYIFKGWAREIENTSTKMTDSTDLFITYNSGSNTYSANYVAADENWVTETDQYHAMYAVWELIHYTVHFDKNAEDATGTMEDQNFAYNEEKGLTTNAFTRDAYDFIGWNTQADGNGEWYSDEQVVKNLAITDKEVVTLYAQWMEKEADVTVEHYLLGQTTPFKTDTIEKQSVGSTYSAIPETTYQERNLTVNNYDPTQSITVQTSGNVIKIYYTLPLKIKAKTDSKTYDGTPLNGEYTVEGALDADETVIETALGDAPSITNVSESPKQYLTETEQAAITGIPSYYSVTYTPGTLTINPKKVTITAKDASQIYNGSALTESGFTTTDLEEGDSHTFTVVMTEGSTITNVGTQPNVIATVDGVAVTTGEETAVGNYLVTTVNGLLTVTRKTVTITAGNASQTYNGSALTESGFTASALEQGDSHTFTVVMTEDSTITDIGTQPNVIATVDGVAVITGTATEVGNYLVTTADGTLTVNPKEVTITAQDANKTYDGDPLTQPGFTATALETGDTHTFTVVMTEDSTITDVGTQPNVIATVDGVAVTAGTPTTVGNYKVTTVSGTLTITEDEASLVITSASQSWPYDGTLHKEETYTVTYNGESVTAGEDGKTFKLPNGDVLTITATAAGVKDVADNAEKNNTYTYVIKRGDTETTDHYTGIVANVGTLTINPKQVTITAGNASRTYNGSALTEDSFTATDLEEGDSHTFTVVMTAASTITNVGTQPNVIATVDGVAVTTGTETTIGNYLVTTADGTLTINRKEVTITANDASKTYDGSALTEPGFTATDLEEGDSHTFTVVMTEASTITNVGTMLNVIATVDGVAVTAGTAKEIGNYLVTTETGKLTVNPKAVTITADDASKTYDGKALTESGFTASALEEGDDHTFTVAMTADSTITNIGTQPNVIATVDGVTVTTGTETKVGNYLVTTADGTLTVNPKKVTITAQDASQTYNGKPLTEDGFTTSALADGDEHEFTVVMTEDSTITNVGTQPNVIATVDGVTVTTGTETAVGNYLVTTADGTLTINPKAVTITAKDASKAYNGEALTESGFTASALEEGDDHTFTVAMTADSTITNVGTQPNVIATVDGVTVTTGEEKAVGNYLVTTADGTLEVTPKRVTITAKDKSKTYDGKALTQPEFTASGLADGDSHTFTVVMTEDSTITDVGTQPNVIATVDGVAVTTGEEKAVGNYLVTTADGTLTITPLSVVVTITGHTSSNKVFNGDVQKVEGYDVSFDSPLYKEADFTFSGEAVAEGTDVGTYPMGLAKNQFKNNNDNFNVTFNVTDGSLTIVPLAVTVKITGKSDSKVYNGEEQTVEGYDVKISDSLYKESDFTFTGAAKASRKDVGTTNMNLAKDQFTNNNDNFDVTFTVDKDGYITIDPADMTVTVQDASFIFDDEAHTIDPSTLTVKDAADNDIADPTIEYSVDGTKWTEEPPTFTEIGEHKIQIRVTKENYNDVTTTATLRIEAPVYTITPPMATWYKGSSDGLVFTFKRSDKDSELCFKFFQDIEIDGAVVDKANYTAVAGSTVVTLKASYLESLALGNHTIKGLFKDGSAQGNFVILKTEGQPIVPPKTVPTPVVVKTTEPKTGDGYNAGLWAMLMTMAAGVMGALGFKRKKEEES